MVESNAFQVQLHQSAQTRKAFVNQNWCFYMACENCLWGEVTSQVPRPTLRTVCLSSQSVNQIGKWFTRPVTEASSCQQGHPSQARKPFAANYKVKPSRELHFFQTPLSALPFLALRIALAVQSWPPGNCSNANMQNQTWPLRLNSWEQGGVDLNLFAPTPTLTNVHIQPPLWPYRI